MLLWYFTTNNVTRRCIFRSLSLSLRGLRMTYCEDSVFRLFASCGANVSYVDRLTHFPPNNNCRRNWGRAPFLQRLTHVLRRQSYDTAIAYFHIIGEYRPVNTVYRSRLRPRRRAVYSRQTLLFAYISLIRVAPFWLLIFPSPLRDLAWLTAVCVGRDG